MMSVELAEFTDYLRQTRGSGHTVARYAADAAEFLAFLGGQPVSVALVERWATALNHGARRSQTVRRKLAAVRALLAWRGAHGDAAAGETLAVLAAGYRVAPPVRQADVKQVQPIGPEEYRAGLARMPVWGRQLAGFLWATGCRISEALGDELAGIRPLTLRQGIRLVRRGWAETVGKGGRRRTIVLAALGRRKLRPWVLAAVRSGLGPDAPLFWSPSDRLRPVSAQSFNAALHGAGIRKGAHAFRHAFAARARRAGVPEHMVAALLGHTPMTTTAGYGQPDVADLMAAAERLQEVE